MMRVVILIACAMVLHVSAAQAASPMVEAFRAYAAALAKGDIITANREGKTAWQEAEKAGNAKYSAILAYNLAEMRLRYLSGSDTATPAARAYELAKANPDGGLAPQTAAVLATLTRFTITGENRSALVKAVRDFEKSGQPPTYPLFRAYQALIAGATKKRWWPQMRKYALLAQNAYTALQLNDPPNLAALKVAGAVATLQHQRFKDTEEPGKELREVFTIMGPQPYGHVHPIVLRTMAWLYAVGSVQKSDFLPVHSIRVKKSTNKLVRKSSDKLYKNKKRTNWIEYAGVPKNCPDYKWTNRVPPKFPRALQKKGYVGATLIYYSLDEAGVPKDIYVAAEVPSHAFGATAAKTVATWRTEPLKGVPPACRENLLTTFSFVLAR